MRSPGCFYHRFGKRALDLTGGGLGLLVLSPLLLVVAAVVRLRLGSPVLFTQERAGRDGRAFRLIKFRSMTDARDAAGRPRPDAERLTPFGHWLRSTSLDELPELWNVVRGEMSLVGPRPLLVDYLPRYNARQARRHEVRPGLTGWSQVEGRNAVAWGERLEHDVWYVDNLSARLDTQVLLRTVSTVFLRTGVAAEGHVTMPEFTGADASADMKAESTPPATKHAA